MLRLSIPYTGGMGAEADRLMLAAGVSALIEWDLPDDDADEAIAPADAAALAAALSHVGQIAFRADFETLPSLWTGRYVPEPKLPFAAWVGNKIRRRDAHVVFGVAVALRPGEALVLFSYGGWSWGVQAAVVFDPALADEERVAAAVGRGLDWRGRRLPEGARLLFGTGHDGAFAIVSAHDEAVLADFARLCQELAPDTVLVGF